MRTSPLIMASIYFGMGALFTYIAVQSVEDTIWNFFTMLLIFFATIDIAVAIRLIKLHIRIKKANKK